MKSISHSNLAIALIWVFVVAASVLGSNGLRPPVSTSFSPAMTITLLVMPILFFGAMPLWARHSPFYHPTLAHYVDGRFGEGAFASFLVRLRPLLLFAVASVVQGGRGLLHAMHANSPSAAYADSGFIVSAGIGFALANELFYLRRAVGVYPADRLTSEQTTVAPTPDRKPLREAIRCYWKNLIGIALFPTVAIVGGDVLHIPFDYLLLPFFAVGFLAAWPCMSKKAPYTFWLVAISVYMAGGVLAVFLSSAIRLISALR
jgi:hypothetical protein